MTYGSIDELFCGFDMGFLTFSIVIPNLNVLAIILHRLNVESLISLHQKKKYLTSAYQEPQSDYDNLVQSLLSNCKDCTCMNNI